MRRKSHSGFTLIELSIVLVVIGLLVGGVLVGRDLIQAAQVRAQITQIENYTTAVNTFRLKYNCLPGDCANAESLGLGSPGGPGQNGNGDGAITMAGYAFTDGNFATNNSFESLNFWYHLGRAGLAEGSFPGYTGQPFDAATLRSATPAGKGATDAHIMPTIFNSTGNVVPPEVPATVRQSRNGFYFFTPMGAWTRRGGLPPLMAYLIDSKIDDGFPHRGNVGCTEVSAMPILLVGPGGWCGWEITNTYSCSAGAVGTGTDAYAMSSAGTCGTVFANKF